MVRLNLWESWPPLVDTRHSHSPPCWALTRGISNRAVLLFESMTVWEAWEQKYATHKKQCNVAWVNKEIIAIKQTRFHSPSLFLLLWEPPVWFLIGLFPLSRKRHRKKNRESERIAYEKQMANVAEQSDAALSARAIVLTSSGAGLRHQSEFVFTQLYS